MENGFSSPRNDAFPAGLRVLVVDDDPTWIKILEKMLKKCAYEVTTCCLAREALNLLRERKDGYDIVISDVNMPDMDGFKLLEHVGLEMDLPVIMMSVDGETSRVMKGVQHGACDYLLKPIRMKELKNIWQHVFRKKIHEVRDIEGHEVFEGMITRSVSDHSDDGYFLRGEDITSLKKRKDVDKLDDRDFSDASSMKKARVVWSVDLHQKFVKAVNQIGFVKVGPKKILDLMNVPWLTRENVASHLQKYRLYLSRLQKENDLKSSFVGMNHPDLSTKDATGNSGLHSTINVHQNDVKNGGYGFSSNNFLLQNVESKVLEGDLKRIVSEPKKPVTGCSIPDPSKKRNSQTISNHSLASVESEVNFGAFDPNSQTQYLWSEAPEIRFRQENKPVHIFNSSNDFSTPHHIQVDKLPSISSLSSTTSELEKDMAGSIESKPLYAEHNSKTTKSHMVIPPLNPRALDSFPSQPKSHMVNPPLEPLSTSPMRMKNPGSNEICVSDTRNGLPFGTYDEDLQFCWLQGDHYNTKNLGHENIFAAYNDPGLISEVPIQLYDSMKLGYEYSYDASEYTLLDEGLFIA